MIGACATQKSRQDQSELGKFYHNVTSKFNGYFNANELLEESIVQLEAQHQDNYNEILPIYAYREAQNPEQVASNLDEAIKKVSVVATLHENSDWVDDCYLLIGKAQYLKQDFESAQNSL
ncbi:MAG: gliding motility protein, partial [Saprospiraceae bacterium]|nr:gliding motility protein [Saprospiraceae bacterium]